MFLNLRKFFFETLTMRLRFFGIIFFMAAFLGCDSPDVPDFCKSIGDEVTQEWHFNSLITVFHINDAFDVSLVKDTAEYAIVTCGKNLIDKVKWQITNPNTVEFTNDNACRIVRNYEGVPKVEIHYTYSDLNVYVNGSCRVHSSDSVDVKRVVFTERIGNLDIITNAPEFVLEVWFGTGRYYVSGKTDCFRCEPRYSAIVDASQLSVKKAFVDNYSTGDVYVNPTDSLTAKIFWTGDIIYGGNPGIKLLENPGKGGLIKK